MAVLFTELSGYMANCLQVLQETHDVQLLVYRWPAIDEAPFSADAFRGVETVRKDAVGVDAIRDHVRRFRPDVLFSAGWNDRDYVRIARRQRRAGTLTVVGMDAQWKGTLRQHLARLTARWMLHRAFDAVWVPGAPQRRFARRLGYRGDRCWDGVYACDWQRFARAHRGPGEDPRAGGAAAPGAGAGRERPAFLYVGRYAPEKGVDVLVKAYRRYRKAAPRPWRLVCAGAGPLEGRLRGEEGIEARGFVQPQDLPALMGEAAAFVLPSRDEPWGVVVQEAAAAGLPLLCTSACGAAHRYLEDGDNGYCLRPGSTRDLAQAMVRMTTLPAEERARMAERSHRRSRRDTPRRWADTLIENASRLLERQAG